MHLTQPAADIHIPDKLPPADALARTTHLCIAAHPDDIEIMAYHGISQCYQNPKKHFTGIIITTGSDNPSIATTRRNEQRQAADLGKYSAQIQLAHTSAAAKNPRNTDIPADLQTILTATPKLQTLYLHNPADKHDTHIAVLCHTLRALRKLPPDKLPTKILGCEVWRTLDWLPDKLPLPTDPHPELARQLVATHQSQIKNAKPYDTATLARRQANATFDNPRAADTHTGLNWAIDLTPLIQNPTLTLAQFMTRHLDHFRDDIQTRLAKYEQPRQAADK